MSEEAIEGIARRAWEAARAGHKEEVVELGRQLAASGAALSAALIALQDLAEHQATQDPAAAARAAHRLAVSQLADGYLEGIAARDEASLRTTTATLAERQAELWALHRVNGAVNSSLDEQEILRVVADTVAEVMRSDVCSIYLFQQPDALVLRATHGLNPLAIGRARMFLGEGLTGRAAREGRPIAVEDLWSDPRSKHLPETAEEPFHSMLSVPIIMYTVNRLIGVLNIQTRQTKAFSAEEVAFVEMVCGELALAIENARSYQRTDQELNRRVEELGTLRRVIALVASTLDFQRVLDTIADQAMALSHTDASAIFQLDRAADRLVMVASRGVAAHSIAPEGLSAQGALGRAVTSAQPLTVGDMANWTARGDTAGVLPGFTSLLCVPFRGRRDTCGAICLYTREERTFSSDTVDLLTGFAGEAAIALENARLYEEAQRSLVAKSALLAEMHHRVKNNLQTVASLLRMGLRHSKSPEAAAVLQESQARIQSIAAVHDLLSQEDIGLTTVDQVVKKVVEIAEVHFRDPAQRISFELAGDNIPIATQQATTLAIVINELLSNAMRHAFPGRLRGTIRISYTALDGQAAVSVGDDGRGLPPSFNLEGAKGLGLSIVDTLTRYDLRGLLNVRSQDGTAFTVTFPPR